MDSWKDALPEPAWLVESAVPETSWVTDSVKGSGQLFAMAERGYLG